MRCQMSEIKDMTGLKFERLTIISRAENNKRGRAMWNCLCDCGKTKKIIGVTLRSGRSKSCGCIRSEMNTERLTVHGMTHSPENAVWRCMKQRCYNPNNKEFHNYGSRGIKVCDRWLESFNNFIEDMGERPTHKHSIERINNNKGYSPGNCKWATMKEQSRNKRETKFFTIDGIKKPLVDWCDTLGMKRSTVYERIRNGWPVEKALYEPIKKC